MKGRTLLTAYWTLSKDGKALNDAFTQYLPDGMTLFAVFARVGDRRLEVTEKFKAKITGARRIELSEDLKTLTITTHLVGESKPQSILVYRRE